MSCIPDSILKHRLPETEIKKVDDKYYMQRITCKWIPEKMQRKKIVLVYHEQFTEEELVSKRQRLATVVASTPRSTAPHGFCDCSPGTSISFSESISPMTETGYTLAPRCAAYVPTPCPTSSIPS